MRSLLSLLFALPALGHPAIWIEGESAAESKVAKHPWYHGGVKTEELSGGDFISHFEKEYPGTASYDFESEARSYELWVRANPVQSRISYQVDKGESRVIDMEKRQSGNVNLAKDDKPDLRFVAWAHAGSVKLAKGKHRIAFRFDSPLDNHGSLDCFVLAPPDFVPMGILNPTEIAAQKEELAKANEGWVPWMPGKDRFAEALLDLRPLNEKFAGENGGIGVKGPDFVYRKTGEKVRFWAVNGPPEDLHGEDLAECARMLAKRGVNLVRMHGAVFDSKTGEYDQKKIHRIYEVVAAMKKEGIYSHISFYFPLWLTPEAGKGWREGYDGKTHPFGLIYFETEFQERYLRWITGVLGHDVPKGMTPIFAEPAVMGLELVNEDSLFFWTFDEKNVPAPQMRKIEGQFAKWAADKYGSVEKAREHWKLPHPRDSADRLGLRPLYQIFTDRAPRDQDTAAFLLGKQESFYKQVTDYVRARRLNGPLVTASNWTTANNDILGPLEKYSYTPGDFIDRHGYFSCMHKGEAAEWSIRDGHTYRDRSALRFEPEEAGKPLDFSHPAADPCFNGMPSMISETTWNRPNRYRGEAPLFYAAYGALQGSDAVVHFALDSKDWSVKPGYFMQPWTLMSPTQMGQFPAAAAIFRLGLVREGEVLADVSLSLEDALALKGSPLAPGANLDELRKADTPAGAVPVKAGGGIDPLIHYAGRTSVQIGGEAKPSKLLDLSRFIDRDKKLVSSSNGDVVLDYGKGLLTLNAPAAQGAVGSLKAAGLMAMNDIEIVSPMEIGQIVAVALDGKPLATSSRILLQVMSEEKATNFATGPASGGRLKITNIGTDPWLVKKLEGEVKFKRADASKLKVSLLDANGMLVEGGGGADRITLKPDIAYYLIAME